MFVGEIGFSYDRFLYGLMWWEVRSIIRGYHNRHHAGWEQARLVAYNAHYCMGSKEPVPAVTEWIKFPWEKKDFAPISDKEREDLLAEMDAINAQLAAQNKE
jgi:hypothetical protein